MATTDFTSDLYRSIRQYFIDTKLSKHADRQMRVKLIVALCWWISSFVLLITAESNIWGFFGWYIFHSLSQLFILFNISHDANHNAIFNKRWPNQVLSYSFELCGINSYMWRQLHHGQHHLCPNIYGEDEILSAARGLIRFTQRAERKFLHRFQHLYFILFYGLIMTDWLLVKDFQCFFWPSTQYLKEKKHPFQEYLKLFVAKSWYLGYMVLLPILYSGYPPATVVAVFLCAQIILGLSMGFVVTISHSLPSLEYPESHREYNNYTYHVLATTADYWAASAFAGWFFGGLHLHVIHHLNPRICHTHYPALTKIIRTVTKNHGVNYREYKTMSEAIKLHCAHLRQLGKTPGAEQLGYG